MTRETIERVQACLTVYRNGGGKKKIIDADILLKRHKARSVICLLKGFLKEKQADYLSWV